MMPNDVVRRYSAYEIGEVQAYYLIQRQNREAEDEERRRQEWLAEVERQRTANKGGRA
jgi:hypothetical protein